MKHITRILTVLFLLPTLLFVRLPAAKAAPGEPGPHPVSQVGDRTDPLFNGATGKMVSAKPDITDIPANDFVITVKTNNPGTSDKYHFTIPTYPANVYNYNVDCNDDGTFEASAQTGDYTCAYSAPGTYTVRIQGQDGGVTGFPSIYFDGGGDAQKLLTIQQWGKGKWNSMNSAFDGCSNLTLTASDAPELSGVTDMSGMFGNASAFNGNIGSWNTSQVTNMIGMFSGASAFNGNIGSWDTSHVNYMYLMFSGASAFNQNIGNWDTSHVIDMRFMFEDASAFNGNISGWNTSNVYNMSGMFYYASAFDQNLGGWNVATLSDATDMFHGVKLSTANYDALLKGWDAQTLQPGVSFDGGSSNYCQGAAARAHMNATDYWVIGDGGEVCKIFLPVIQR